MYMYICILVQVLVEKSKTQWNNNAPAKYNEPHIGRILEFHDSMNVQGNIRENLQYRAEFSEMQEIQTCTVDFPSHFLMFPCTFSLIQVRKFQ